MSELPNAPLSRIEGYLNNIATGEATKPPAPLSRIEQYLDYIAENGGGGVKGIIAYGQELPPDDDGKINIASIKTTMDTIAVPMTQYYLGEQDAVSITMPATASAGQQISVVFYSGTTVTVLSVSGDVIGDMPVPTTNSRYELNFEYDGFNWSLLSIEQAVT